MPALVLPQILLCGLFVPRDGAARRARGDQRRAAAVVRRRRDAGAHPQRGPGGLGRPGAWSPASCWRRWRSARPRCGGVRPERASVGAMTTSDTAVAVAAARAGAAVALAAWRTPVARHGKGGIDFATDADLASERAVRDVLREQRPDDAVTGEEYGSRRRRRPHLAGRPDLRDPQLRRRHAAVRGQRGAARGRPRSGSRRSPTRPRARSSSPTATAPGATTAPTSRSLARLRQPAGRGRRPTRRRPAPGRCSAGPGSTSATPRAWSRRRSGWPWVAAGRFAGYVAEERRERQRPLRGRAGAVPRRRLRGDRPRRRRRVVAAAGCSRPPTRRPTSTCWACSRATDPAADRRREPGVALRACPCSANRS